MAVPQRLKHTARQAQRLRRVQAALAEHGSQRSAGHIFHHQERGKITRHRINFLTRIEDPDNGRVVEARCVPTLGPKERPGSTIVAESARQLLDRHGPRQPNVEAKPDDRHPAATELGPKSIAAAQQAVPGRLRRILLNHTRHGVQRLPM
jgi:hypothetical protein